ncbi:hypothetical protein ABG067_005635 [Albugo candida]
MNPCEYAFYGEYEQRDNQSVQSFDAMAIYTSKRLSVKSEDAAKASELLLRASWEEYEPEQLQLLLGVYHYVETNTLTENEFITPIFNKKKPLLTATNVKLFSKAFKASSSCYPRIHSLWYGLLAALLSQDDDKTPQSFTLFEDVWKALVDDLLLENEHTTHERKGLVFKLFELILTKVPATVLHGTILSHKLVTSLFPNLFASSLPAEFIRFLEQQILYPSKLAATLEAKPYDSTMDKEAHLTNLLEIEEERDFAQDLEKRVHHIRVWALDQLIQIVSQDILKHDKNDMESKGCELLNVYDADQKWSHDGKIYPISEPFRETLMKRVLVLVSSNIASDLPATTLQFSFNLIHKKLLKLCKERKKSNKCTLQCAGGQVVAKNAFVQFPKTASLVQNLQLKSKHLTENVASIQAFQLLVMFVSIQLLDASSSDEAVVVLQDLERSSRDIFYDEAATTSKSNVETTDPVAVLIDILLSMLAQDSSAVRNVVMHVFQSVLTLVNRKSLESIAHVFTARKSKTDDEEENEEGESSEGEDEEGEDEQDEEEILLDSEEASNALWENITSLDQDDMALAAIVRQVKDTSTKKHETKLMEQRQIHFQLRVLDLLQVYLSRGSKQSFMLLIVPPLLDRLHATERGIKHERVLHERIRTLFKLIHSRAKLFISVESASEENVVLVNDAMEHVVKALISRNMSKPTSNICVSLLIFLVRHAYSQPALTKCVGDVMDRVIENSFTRKHGRFPRRFFDEFVVRHHTEALQLLLPRFCTCLGIRTAEKPQIADPFLQSEARRLLSILMRSKALLREPASIISFIKYSPRIQRVIVGSMTPESDVEAKVPMKAKRIKTIITLAREYLQTCTKLQSQSCSMDDNKRLQTDMQAVLKESDVEAKVPMKAKRIKTIITLAREYLQTCTKLQSQSCSMDDNKRLQTDMQAVLKGVASFKAASKSPVYVKELEKLLRLQLAL